MENQKKKYQRVTTEEYFEGLKAFREMCRHTNQFKMISFVEKYRMSHYVIPVLRDAKIIETQGGKRKMFTKWIGIEPNMAMAKRVHEEVLKVARDAREEVLRLKKEKEEKLADLFSEGKLNQSNNPTPVKETPSLNDILCKDEERKPLKPYALASDIEPKKDKE